MPTTIGIGNNGIVEEVFVVSEPVEVVETITNRLIKNLTEPTFGTDAWSIALEFKSHLVLVSENVSKNSVLDVFYNRNNNTITVV